MKDINEIIMIDGMPCIVLKHNTLGEETSTKLGEGSGSKKDFTQLQYEKTQMFIKELLDEIKAHGYIFY